MAELEPEILINISFRVPQLSAMDRDDFALKLEPIIHQGIMLGGSTLHFSMQPYDPDSDD